MYLLNSYDYEHNNGLYNNASIENTVIDKLYLIDNIKSGNDQNINEI